MPFHYLSHHLKSIQPLQFFSHFKTLQQQPIEQNVWIHLSTFQLQHAKSNVECIHYTQSLSFVWHEILETKLAEFLSFEKLVPALGDTQYGNHM